MCICTSSASKYYYIISKCLLTGKNTKRRLQRDNKRQAGNQSSQDKESWLYLCSRTVCTSFLSCFDALRPRCTLCTIYVTPVLPGHFPTSPLPAHRQTQTLIKSRQLGKPKRTAPLSVSLSLSVLVISETTKGICACLFLVRYRSLRVSLCVSALTGKRKRKKTCNGG